MSFAKGWNPDSLPWRLIAVDTAAPILLETVIFRFGPVERTSRPLPITLA
jgi:hypothetical protein